MGKGSSAGPAGSALHTVGSRVWVWDSGDWLRAEVVAMAGPRLRVRLEEGGERECAAADIPLQNSSASGVEVSRRLAGPGGLGWVGGLAVSWPEARAGGLVHHSPEVVFFYLLFEQGGWHSSQPGACAPAGPFDPPPDRLLPVNAGCSGGGSGWGVRRRQLVGGRLCPTRQWESCSVAEPLPPAPAGPPPRVLPSPAPPRPPPPLLPCRT